MPVETWGEFDPGKGFLIGRTSAGELAISGYALVRYVNQMPGEQTFTDHLGNTRAVDGRNDIWPHRVMVFLKGWIGTPKLVYAVTLWTVLDTNQNAIFGNLGYQFSRKFSVYAGLNGNPGIALAPGLASVLARPRPRDGRRVLPAVLQIRRLGPGRAGARPLVQRDAGRHQQHPRCQVEPARPEFTTGALGVVDADDEGVRPPGRLRRLGAAREGGHPVRRLVDVEPRAALHQLRGGPDNTTLRLADSVNVFETGALAPGVTVQTVDYRILSFDAGVKYRGFFLQTEYYNRWLDNFKADGALPVGSIHDTGFYVQAAFYPVPKKLELYAATSQIFGDKSAGFSNSSEYPGRDELLSRRTAATTGSTSRSST